MKVLSILATAALVVGQCGTITAAAPPLRDSPSSQGVRSDSLPLAPRAIDPPSWREMGLITVTAGGALLHFFHVRGKNRVIDDLQTNVQIAESKLDEQLKSSWRAYKQALTDGGKDRSFKSSSHRIDSFMAADKVLMKCILDGLGLGEVVRCIAAVGHRRFIERIFIVGSFRRCCPQASGIADGAATASLNMLMLRRSIILASYLFFWPSAFTP
jgi:hypothetical protein